MLIAGTLMSSQRFSIEQKASARDAIHQRRSCVQVMAPHIWRFITASCFLRAAKTPWKMLSPCVLTAIASFTSE